MATQANGSNLLIGRGKCYFNRLVNGVYAGLRFVGDVDKVELNPQTTEKERYSMSKAAAPLLRKTTTQQIHTLSLTLMEFTKENVAMALLGYTAPVTQTSASPTNETIFTGGVGVAPDSILRLAKRNVSAVVLTATGGSSPTPLVLGTDYEIEDAAMGLIHILPTASTVPLATITLITAAYTAGTSTINRVYGGTTADIIGQWVFIGDPATGPVLEVEVWSTHVKPSAALGLISDDYAQMTLEAQVLDDSLNHPTAPLYQVTYR